MSESPFGHQPSPVPTADIRSQAIAMLKRAASLPRTPDGRRHVPQVTAGGPSAVSMSEDGHGGSTSYVTERSMTPSPTRGGADHFGDEEMLAASPAGSKTAGGGANMQRSASDSSRFKANTPPHLAYASANTSPFFTAQPSPASSGAGADWGGSYPHTPSYLPSISPVPTPPSSFPANLQTPRAGRNTPSPLPTLGELRNLSRSNSAAARQNAMNKLIGGGASTPTPGGDVATPVSSSDASEEDLTLSLPGSARSLHRAGTIGVPRMFGMPAETAVDDSTLTPIPDTAFDVPRPRLQRSFTVSSSNMGEERRSAVGRRMVERLAERRAARQQEEQEVRTLWEERRRTRGSQKGISLATPEDTPPRPLAAPATAPSAAPSVAAPHPPSKLALPGITALGAGAGAAGAAALLASQAVDRTPSRSTERSDDVFEYESHLNRSMSARTARTERTERTDVFDSSPAPQAMPLYQHGGEFLGEHGEDDPTPLPIPELPFTSPIRHVPSESISSAGTALGRAPDLARLSPTPASKERTASAASGDPFDVADYPSSAYSGSYPGSYHEIKPNGTSSWDPAHGRVSPHDAYNLAPNPTRRRNGFPESDGPEYTEVYDDSRPDSNASGVSQASNYNDTNEYTRHSKNSSISKMGRAVLTAMKSRSSGASSPPRSPALQNGTATSRRPSEASNSNSHSQQSHSSQRGVSPVQEPRAARQTATAPRAKPSPYKMEEHASSANTLLIQHQLSAAPSPLHFLPRANPSDPRIHNSKLSPFPGIASLEQQQRNKAQTNGSPQLRQNRSDTSVSTAALSPQIDMGRKSGDSERRRPGVHMVKHSRSSHGSGSGLGSHSESSHSHTHSQNHSQSHSQSHSHSYSYSEDHRNGGRSSESLRRDAPATRTTPSPEVVHRVVGSNIKQRPDIPSFMMNRRRAPPPPPLDVAESNVVSINDDPTTPPAKSSDMPARSRDVLGRMDNMFALSNNDPSRPDFLDDPPRKLLLAQQVLQVVNVQTVKDRYLFLFNDILVIAKPILGSNTADANLDMKFIVKSIVGLEKLIVSGIGDEPTTEPPRHPAVKQFIQHFAEDSSGAVNELVERSNPILDTPTLAGVLFATPELDKTQLGNLLSVDPHLLLAFVDKFNFAGVRIDDAMRIFLQSIRLPTDISAAQVIMRGFAEGYYRANEREIEFDDAAVEELVFATLELNDMLYSTFGFAFPNHAVSHDTFVGAFRRMDPRRSVPEELLDEIFASIRSNKLAQALSPHETCQARDALFTPARLPTRLRYQEWSDVFKVSITEADPAFRIELVSSGLEFDPPVLDFSRAPEASFRVRGRALGSQTMLIKRLGANASLYPGLGTSRVFQVERSFMRNAFHVSFATPSGTKRRYCFSVSDAAARQRWGSMLSRQVWLTTEKKQGAGAPTTTKGRVRAAAEAVALQVLRDTLIPRDAREGSEGQASANDISARMLKHGSVSVAYAKAKDSAAEADLGPLQPTRGHAHTDSTGSMVELQTGKELVLLCRQNSLLPSVLELLQGGTGNGNGDATAKTHAAQPQPQAPAQPQNANSQAQVAVRAAHLANGQQPLRSAGLKAMMHDRRL